MKDYKFYNNGNLNINPINKEYNKIKNHMHLYDLLSNIWSKETCAPRLQDKWSKENMTLGQCSITAFLAQDIFGGTVYGILRPDGNYHCYNVVGEAKFDLTSEQFLGEKLNYDNNPIQLRDNHFKKEEKYKRYLYLADKLKSVLKDL